MGCRDDFMADGLAEKGMARVCATVDFKPMSVGLVQTRAAGDAIKEISSLHVLLYDYQSGKLVKSYSVADYKASEMDRADADAENGVSAESRTKRVTFELPEKIAFGRYCMYAVANIPDLLEVHAGAVGTVAGLKSLPLTWNATDMAANGQMIGYFTKTSSVQPEDQPLELHENTLNLHAWLRRAASKVTVAYDGSGLKEGVFIYIQSVQIKDIPQQCYLGKDNNVGAAGYALDFPANGPDMPDGETIYYHDGGHSDDFDCDDGCKGHCIMVGAPYLGSHGETDPALFFYENMQGTGKDKRQDADGDGVLDAPGLPNDPDKYPDYKLKDDKTYGTYIEVKARYISNNSEKLGNGPITYRFMLGQDVMKDYDARRNCHYKVTLKFKNFANEADWHIEYEEPEPGVMTPEPYYISYLYNHSMMYPIKVATGGRKIEYMKAEIIDNRWAPHNAEPEVYYDKMDLPEQNQWNGFLSLHQTMQTVIFGTTNEFYYNQIPKRGEREYRDFDEGEFATAGSESTDTYRVVKHPTEADTYNIYIPMYTRAKQLITTTGYTGNNPYVAHQRKAIVKITTKLEGLNPPFENIVHIYQVRRIVNPKGIYRSSGNNKSFHVVLKRLPEENAERFETFQSDGPWRAYVVSRHNGDGITLSGRSGKSELVRNEDPVYGDIVHGKTGSTIDFNVDFKGGSPGANRYAIIRVEYHNYTCQHLIFVRQGNEPDNLLDGDVLWYAENMKTRTERAHTPLEEGSLFKFGNWDDPIDALNNRNSKAPWIHVEPEDFKLSPADGLVIAGTGETKQWDEIPFASMSETFADPTSDMRVAQDADYRVLFESEEIEQGYGVLYGDDAVATADHIDEVYGYDYTHNSEGRGMRGCFVYNKVTGKNLFFPIGASGYGHRRNAEHGILRYSSGRQSYYPLPGVKDCPLFYDIFRRPGGVYWYNSLVNSYMGWDINYFTFDFNSIGYANVASGKDACFVRCIKKEP